jgi:class 3 adenylate cyclase
MSRSISHLFARNQSLKNFDTPDMSIKSKWMKYMSHHSVREAMDNHNRLHISEIRHVVTIFIEITGLEKSFATGSTGLPQKALSIVLNVLQRFEGLLRQFVVDDKGCVMIAAFGVPQASHADNHVRAVETAISVRTLLCNIACSCRVGITSGKVFCGLVGAKSRCEYAMMGSTVNLAARLMSGATYGEIIVSADVQLECTKSFAFRSLQPINAKGYEHPITVYSPEERLKVGFGRKNLSMERVKFIGRETELKTLLSAFDAMADEGGHEDFKSIDNILPPTMRCRFFVSDEKKILQRTHTHYAKSQADWATMLTTVYTLVHICTL